MSIFCMEKASSIEVNVIGKVSPMILWIEELNNFLLHALSSTKLDNYREMIM